MPFCYLMPKGCNFNKYVLSREHSFNKHSYGSYERVETNTVYGGLGLRTWKVHRSASRSAVVFC